MRMAAAALAALMLAGCAAGRTAAPDPAITSQEIVTLRSRPGVDIRVGLMTPAGKPRGVVLMLPGGNGAGEHSFRAGKDGRIVLGHNFVIRTAPDFVRRGYIVAMTNSPSDRSLGMTLKFRHSREHHADILRALEFLRERHADLPLFMAGFCVGNPSITSLAQHNKDLPVSGLILISGVWQGGISRGNISGPVEIPYPVLLVHHKANECSYCLVEGARAYFELLRTRGRKDLTVAEGGKVRAGGNPCGPFHYQGFEGMEERVVGVIADWMDGREVPREFR